MCPSTLIVLVHTVCVHCFITLLICPKSPHTILHCAVAAVTMVTVYWHGRPGGVASVPVGILAQIHVLTPYNQSNDRLCWVELESWLSLELYWSCIWSFRGPEIPQNERLWYFLSFISCIWDKNIFFKAHLEPSWDTKSLSWNLYKWIS